MQWVTQFIGKMDKVLLTSPSCLMTPVVRVSIWYDDSERLAGSVLHPQARQGYHYPRTCPGFYYWQFSHILLSSVHMHRNKLLGLMISAQHPSSWWHLLMHKSHYTTHLLRDMNMQTCSQMLSNLVHCKAEEMAQLRLGLSSVRPPNLSSTFQLCQPANLKCLNDSILRLKE